MIKNERFVIKVKEVDGSKLLDEIEGYFRRKGIDVLRFYIAEVRKNAIVVEASIVGE